LVRAATCGTVASRHLDLLATDIASILLTRSELLRKWHQQYSVSSLMRLLRTVEMDVNNIERDAFATL
jgi:hypothetical protein